MEIEQHPRDMRPRGEFVRQFPTAFARGLPEAIGEREGIEELIEKTHACRKRISERLARGQDRLLERSSHRPERSAWLVKKIREWDEDSAAWIALATQLGMTLD